uniref:PAT1 homolog 2 n=1 Tax=Myripristis murdjan TaxID=586833 RepID=A0A668AW71_9TELE
MSDSEQGQETEDVSQRQWPENGEQWSDGEDEADMDCGLQAMAEEDEEIDLHNDETFGMDLDANETTGEPRNGLLQFKEPPSPPPLCPPSPIPTSVSKPAAPPSSHCTSPPHRQRPHFLPQVPPGQRGRGRGKRGGLRGDQMFEDPAVMRIVEGRPSLKVIAGLSPYDLQLPGLAISCLFLQGQERGPQRTLQQKSLHPKRPVSGAHCRDLISLSQNFNVQMSGVPCHFPHSLYFQMHTSMMPGSPILSRQPLTPRQHYNQTGAFPFPLSRPCPSTPQSLNPKMMQLRFGTNSPRPSPVYSPSSNPVQHLRYPGPVTQLHPQHKRLLSQKKHGWDPYCNLMTAKEKEWITRLQMIQLQTVSPYLEDYYYQEYYRRIEAKLAEEELGIRSKREPPKLTTPYITKTDSYTPVVHIEGSLGQVAVSTCYSPRRAISAVHAVQAQEQKDTRQQRLEVLSKIEKLFIVLLEVEEAERMKATAVGEAESRLKEKTQRKVENIYSQLKHHDPSDSGGEFLPFLLVSKGKRLVARLLLFLDRESALNILHVVTSNLPTLMSRDTDESLPVLYPPLRTVIGGLTFSQLIGVLKDLTTSESLTTYECLTLACQNKFGLSLLYALLSQGERLLSSGVPLEPSIGDFEAWTDTIFQVAGQLSQCSLVEPLLLPSNLLTLFCRYLDKRTVHQLKSNMESATGFLALMS